MGLLTYLSLGFLFAGLSLKGVEADCCPMEWLPLQGNCYRIFPTKMTWNAAATACQNQFRGCNLASIHDQQEADELAKYVTKYRPDSSNVWIGLHDPQKNRQWRWIDNSPVLYLAWNPGEPNNLGKDENCVELWSQSGYKKWNDVNCGQQRPYLCKFKL